MGTVVPLLLIAVFGAALVVGLAQLIRLSPRFARLPTGLLLAVSHTLIMSGRLALSLLYIAAEQATASPWPQWRVKFTAFNIPLTVQKGTERPDKSERRLKC